MTTYTCILHTCAAEQVFRSFFPRAAQTFPFCAHMMMISVLERLNQGTQQKAAASDAPFRVMASNEVGDACKDGYEQPLHTADPSTRL